MNSTLIAQPVLARPPSEAPNRFYFRALWLILLAGIGCRVAQYGAHVSYWHDEALVTLNVMDKPMSQLVGRLDFAQAAPPLFLITQRAMYLAFGASEFSQRLFSLVCGVGSLTLFCVLCRRLLPIEFAVWTVAFYAFSDKLIQHSAETKPYGCDALMAVTLLFIMLAWRNRSPGARLAAMSAVTVPGLWFSFPSAIMFGGLSLMLLPAMWRRGWRGLLQYAGCNAAVGASFLLLYFKSVKPQHVAYLSDFWAPDFPDFTHPLHVPVWLFKEIYALCDHPYRSFGMLMLPLAIAGAIGLYRSGRREFLAACLIPLALAILAACLRQYPFNGERTATYLLPSLFLLCGGGLFLLRDALAAQPKPLRLAWMAIAICIAGRGVAEAGYKLFVPRTTSGIRPAVAYARAHRQPGEQLYLTGQGLNRRRPNGKEFFSFSGDLARESLCYWHYPPQPWEGGVPDDLSVIAGPRFWVLMTSPPKYGRKSLEGLKKYLAPVADVIDFYEAPGSGGFAIEFRLRGE